MFGYGILSPQGMIYPNTIHEHPRGSMVNYLWTEARLGVTEAWTDEIIREVFMKIAEDTGVKVMRVKIEATEEIDISEGEIA